MLVFECGLVSEDGSGLGGLKKEEVAWFLVWYSLLFNSSLISENGLVVVDKEEWDRLICPVPPPCC